MRNQHCLSLFMTILTSFFMVGCMQEKMSYRDTIINQVIHKTVQDVNSLSLGNDFYLVGTGGGLNHDTGKLKRIAISFHLHHPLSKEACRWLVVEIAKIFLTNINGSRELSQYLPDGHFTYRNIDVSVFFSTLERTSLYYPDIVCASLYNGKISYAKNDPKDKNGGYSPYKEVVYESFEEALKIVDSQERPIEL